MYIPLYMYLYVCIPHFFIFSSIIRNLHFVLYSSYYTVFVFGGVNVKKKNQLDHMGVLSEKEN